MPLFIGNSPETLAALAAYREQRTSVHIEVRTFQHTQELNEFIHKTTKKKPTRKRK